MLRLPIEGLDSRWQMLALSWIWAPRSSSLILLAGGIRLIVPNKDNSRLLSPKKIYVNARCIHAIDTGVCAVSKGFIQTQQGCLDAPLCKLPLLPNLPTLRKGYSFICVWALGGEEKAGFGAQPREFDTRLPCPGDISNNIKGFGASSFKMLLRSPIPQ